MLLLVTDTSGKHGSVALARAGEGADPEKVELIAEVPLEGGTFSAQLVPQIAALLAGHGLSKADIDTFIVVSGPGSFTGLRVGLAVIKALAEVLGKPIVPVSLLEIVAVASGRQGKVVAALDAGRGEAYAGEYYVTRESAQLRREQLLPKDQLFSAPGEVVVVLNGSLDWVAPEDSASVLAINPPGAAGAARLGWRKLQAGESVGPEQLEANYIRRSDAEIFGKSTP